MTSLNDNYSKPQNNSADNVFDPKWTKLFTPCIADYDKSSGFMTRAIFVGFSVILSRRKILPPSYFTKNQLTDQLSFHSLSFKNLKSLKLAELLRQAGEAIRLGFLKEIALVITENEDDEKALEVHSFKFHYYESGVAAHFNSSKNPEELTPLEKVTLLEYSGTESVRGQLIMLTQSLAYLCEKVLRSLPQKHDANFRLDYTDEAPRGFRVEGFFESPTLYTFPNDMQSATLGHLRPGHHGTLIDCSSIFMSDSFQAELALKRCTDILSEKFGLAANQTFYHSFSSEGTTSQESNKVLQKQKTSDDKSLVGTIENERRNTQRPNDRSTKESVSPYSRPSSSKH